MIYKPRRIKGIAIGTTLIVLLAVVNYWNVQRALEGQINLSTFWRGLFTFLSMPLAGFVAYRIHGITALRYIVSRDGMIIRWAGVRHFVPMQEIERVVPASEIQERVGFFGIAWPGCWVGPIRAKGLGTGKSYSAVPPSRQLLVITSEAIYGISPSEPGVFLTGFWARHHLGVIRRWEPRSEESGVRLWPIWKDRYVLSLLLAALVINLAVFGYTSAAYPGLPPILSSRLSMLGVTGRPGARVEVFALPALGMLFTGVDAVLGMVLYRKERTLAYVSFGFAVLVQLLILNAAARIVF